MNVREICILRTGGFEEARWQEEVDLAKIDRAPKLALEREEIQFLNIIWLRLHV